MTRSVSYMSRLILHEMKKQNATTTIDHGDKQPQLPLSSGRHDTQARRSGRSLLRVVELHELQRGLLHVAVVLAEAPLVEALLREAYAGEELKFLGVLVGTACYSSERSGRRSRHFRGLGAATSAARGSSLPFTTGSS